jgi:hypothetical protein
MNPEERAPGWRIRCRKCGMTELWGKYGIRKNAAGTAYTIGWCPRCRWIRTHAIERVPKAQAGNQTASNQASEAIGAGAPQPQR